LVVGVEGDGNGPGPTRQAGRGTLPDGDRQVLALIASGARDQDIATVTHMSLDAVKRRVRQLLIRLDAQNRTEAVVRAMSEGLI
jgi:DNA-binding NarL/FixJ family response regulator